MERIRRNRRVEVTAAGSGTDLVLADQKARAERWIVDNVGSLKPQRQRTADSHAMEHGRAAGEQAATGERELSTPRAIGAGA